LLYFLWRPAASGRERRAGLDGADQRAADTNRATDYESGSRRVNEIILFFRWAANRPRLKSQFSLGFSLGNFHIGGKFFNRVLVPARSRVAVPQPPRGRPSALHPAASGISANTATCRSDPVYYTHAKYRNGEAVGRQTSQKIGYRWLPQGLIFTVSLQPVRTVERLARLCHKARRLLRVRLRAQHGHRGRVRAIATISLRWSVAIELGT